MLLRKNSCSAAASSAANLLLTGRPQACTTLANRSCVLANLPLLLDGFRDLTVLFEHHADCQRLHLEVKTIEKPEYCRELTVGRNNWFAWG